MKTWKITLSLTVDDTVNPPTEWLWSELLALGSGESATLVEATPVEGGAVDLPTCTCAACTKTQVVVPFDEPPLDDYDCRACGHSMYLHQDGVAQCDVAGCTCTTWCDPTIFGMCDEDHSIFADEPAQYSDDPVVPSWPGLYLLASVTDHCGEEGLCWYHCSDAPTHLSKAEAQIEALAQAMESEVG